MPLDVPIAALTFSFDAIVDPPETMTRMQSLPNFQRSKQVRTKTTHCGEEIAIFCALPDRMFAQERLLQWRSPVFVAKPRV